MACQRERLIAQPSRSFCLILHQLSPCIVSLVGLNLMPFSRSLYNRRLRMQCRSMRMTWPVQRTCDSMSINSMLVESARSKISTCFQRTSTLNFFSFVFVFVSAIQGPHFASVEERRETLRLYTFSFADRRMLCWSNTLKRSLTSDWLSLLIRFAISLSS